MDCAEYKRLVALHLKAIAKWKNTFDDPEAWEKVIDAERVVVEHYQEHGCREISEGRNARSSDSSASP